VCKELQTIVPALIVPEENALRVAARWHDWGKAHPAFQVKIDDGQELVDKDGNGNPQFRRKRDDKWVEWAGRRDVAKAPGKRWNQLGELVDPGYWPRSGKAKDGFRRHFRHELASALAVLQRPHDHLKVLSDDDLNLVAYLIAAHHGKVRLSIRSLPNELRPRDGNGTAPQKRFARGVWDGDALPETNLGTENGKPIIAPAVKLSLEPMETGLCEQPPFAGQPSWAERMIRLRDALGPFRLAYLEALLRAADIRASAKAEKRGTTQ
jgi:CRISPR-associated endonuclease/helicase Cas3